MKKRIAIEIVSFLFILLFTYAAISKMQDVEKFRAQIGLSPLLTNFAGLVSWLIPLIEIVISLLLSWSRTRLIGLYASFGLMVMFTAYIVAITQFSFFVPCSCGGIMQTMNWTEHLFFNVGFILLGLIGIIVHSKNQDQESVNRDNKMNEKSNKASMLVTE